MKIYVIRHGETDWNVARRLQGRSNTDLNENGKKLAQMTGEALKGVPFACVFTSPLNRAVETAELVLAGRKIPIIPDERLLEISFGEYEGLSSKSTNYEIPDLDFMNFFQHPENYRTPPGGESLDQVEERTAAFLEDICSRQELEDQTVLVSTHGCAMRGLLNSLRNAPRSDYWNGGVPKNCGVALIESQKGKKTLLWENKTFY
ncbi:MAG: histidine phosphatase family protein [Candidatus Limivivens sp.]|nr:histidine phosphatase family protein [Candidatus Limivivens sp.]